MNHDVPADVTIWNDGKPIRRRWPSGDPPIPDGLAARLNTLSAYVPQVPVTPEAEADRLRAQVRNWTNRLARIEGDAAALWDDWRGTAELIDEANTRLDVLRSQNHTGGG